MQHVPMLQRLLGQHITLSVSQQCDCFLCFLSIACELKLITVNVLEAFVHCCANFAPAGIIIEVMSGIQCLCDISSH